MSKKCACLHGDHGLSVDEVVVLGILHAFAGGDADSCANDDAEQDLVEDDEDDPPAYGVAHALVLSENPEEGKVEEGEGGAVVAAGLALEDVSDVRRDVLLGELALSYDGGGENGIRRCDALPKKASQQKESV